MEGMRESATILNSQLSFLDTRLALIRIPFEAYPLFIRPILQLLLHNHCKDEEGNSVVPKRPWMFWYPFVNVSITPNECSIVCPRKETDRLFSPVMKGLDIKTRNSVSTSVEDYSAILISGEGLDASQRVLDLTTPLAIAGISIFFITSYSSDFILVPYPARTKVIRALENRGFIFETETINGNSTSMISRTPPDSRLLHEEGPWNSLIASSEAADSWTIASISDLQSKTFQMLREKNISPRADRSIELVTCAGIKDSTATSAASNYSEGKLQLGLTKCLTSTTPPKFLSLTLTDSESASLTLEKRLLACFHNEGEDLLLGKDGPEQIAITLDLRQLPFESTGIVCGVASRLIRGMEGRTGEVFNMAYLSTARAGHVIVYLDELEDALAALSGKEHNGVGEG